MPRRNVASSWLLIALPAPLIALVSLLPLGPREQGWLAELVGSDLPRTSAFTTFAESLRLWSAAAFVLAFAVAAVGWYLNSQRWRRRMLTFDPQQVVRHRAFVYAGMVATTAAAAALASMLFLLGGPPFISVPGRVIVAGVCGALAGLEFLGLTLAVPSTRRLYRGF